MAAIAISFSTAAAAVARRRSPAHLQLVARRGLPFCAAASAPPAAAAGFSWADALRVARDAGVGDESDLSGYFRKVDICNRGMDKKGEFVEFLVEDQVVGYIHKDFTEHLRDFHDVFTIVSGNNGKNAVEHVTLHSSLRTPEDRTIAIGDVIKGLGELIPGIRNELYPVTSSYGMPVYFSLERAAAPYFGIKAYGVHMNGYTEKDGGKSLWIGKRSDVKQTYPGMLDHLVAGGLVSFLFSVFVYSSLLHSIGTSIEDGHMESPVKTISSRNVKRKRESQNPCQPSNMLTAEICTDIPHCLLCEELNSYKRDVLFCYELRLPVDFVPNNEDGEVDSFRLIPVPHAANIIRRTDFFKPNCNLVIIDFLFRHGYVNPDCNGYLKLLTSLRGGDCS